MSTIGGVDAYKMESSVWADGPAAWARASDRNFELRVIPRAGPAPLTSRRK